jgi:hypothetical protein
VTFFKNNLRIFRQIGLPVFILVVLFSNIDLLLTKQVEEGLRSLDGAPKSIYIYGFISLILGVVFPIFTTVTCLFALSSHQTKISLGEFYKKYLNQIYIETLRSWGKTLLWSLLFILPGIWKYIEYSLVPFVVTDSPPYDEGKEDALKRSAQIVRRHIFAILGVLIIFHLGIPLMLSSLFDAYRLFWQTPVQSLLLNLLDTYLFIISTQLLFVIFRSEVPHDAHV